MSERNIRKLPVFVFDMGGVVIKWPGNDPIFRYVAERYRVPVMGMKEAMQHDLSKVESGELRCDEYMRRSLERVGRKLENNDSADGLIAYPFEKLVELDQSAVGLIRSLKRRGYHVFALTNTPPPHLEVMKRHGWTLLFDGFFASCELNSIKPETKIYLLMLRAIRAKPEDVVFVDDREENIRGAKGAGISNAILFRSVASLKVQISNVIGA